MGTAVLVDTDVMVDYLRGHDKAVLFPKKQAGRIILSLIVVAELYAGVKGDAEKATLDDVVSRFRVVPVTVDLAKTAGLLKRDSGKSHDVGLADAVIAAMAHVEYENPAGPVVLSHF